MSNNVGKNISDRRKELGITQEELAHKLGYKSKSTINKIELGINDITQTKLMEFAKALDTTPGYLMGWEGAIKELRLRNTEEEQKLIDMYNELNDEGKEMALSLVKTLMLSGQYKKHNQARMVEEEA